MELNSLKEIYISVNIWNKADTILWSWYVFWTFQGCYRLEMEKNRKGKLVWPTLLDAKTLLLPFVGSWSQLGGGGAALQLSWLYENFLSMYLRTLSSLLWSSWWEMFQELTHLELFQDKLFTAFPRSFLAKMIHKRPWLSLSKHHEVSIKKSTTPGPFTEEFQNSIIFVICCVFISTVCMTLRNLNLF